MTAASLRGAPLFLWGDARLAPGGVAALNRRRGRLAQLVRASRLHREGRRFESVTAYQPDQIVEGPGPRHQCLLSLRRSQAVSERTSQGEVSSSPDGVTLAVSVGNMASYIARASRIRRAASWLEPDLGINCTTSPICSPRRETEEIFRQMTASVGNANIMPRVPKRRANPARSVEIRRAKSGAPFTPARFIRKNIRAKCAGCRQSINAVTRRLGAS